ncbi:MAG: hypothetical protein PHV42_00520 [Candidatus Pacebacteria bacterium]|nr:hypothetical protein [Candidatus Paceibacterota bacterium]
MERNRTVLIPSFLRELESFVDANPAVSIRNRIRAEDIRKEIERNLEQGQREEIEQSLELLDEMYSYALCGLQFSNQNQYHSIIQNKNELFEILIETFCQDQITGNIFSFLHQACGLTQKEIVALYKERKT